MAKTRTVVPRRVADDLLHANQHTCCLCKQPRQPVEIHHINGDPSDHRLENLAVLCRNCHGLASQTGPLGRRISSGEVTRAKAAWEGECSQGGAEGPDIELHEEVLVPAGDHRGGDDWCYRIFEGAVVSVGIDSDVAVNVMLGREREYQEWLNGEPASLLDLRSKVFRCELSHEIASKNDYVIWIENEQDEDAIVEVDIAVWPPDDEEDGEDGEDGEEDGEDGEDGEDDDEEDGEDGEDGEDDDE